MKAYNKTKAMKKQITLNILAIALFVILLNFSIMLSPEKNMETRDNLLNFRWIGFSSYALVDDNPDFVSPIKVEKASPVELAPGKYYWCVPFFNSCLKKDSFEIISEVGLSVTTGKIENETVYRIENKGNTRVLLGWVGLITGQAILEPDAVAYENASKIEKITASQNE